MSIDTLHDEIERQIEGQLTYDLYRDGVDRAAHKLAYRVLTVLGMKVDPDAVSELRTAIHSKLETVAVREGWDEDEADEGYDAPMFTDEPNLTLIKGEK